MADPQKLRRRLLQLGERWELPDEALRQLEQLLYALAADPYAPTSVAKPLSAADVHIADSLSALRLLRLRQLTAAVDIGSGAGFPSLALAIALPDTPFDLVESSARKCRFLERMIAAANIENAHVQCCRAEDWAGREGAGRYSEATARALGSLGLLVEYAAPLLQRGGLLVAWKGRRDIQEEQHGEAVAARLGMRPLGAEPVGPFPGSGARNIYLYEKVGELPPGFPRRAGMAKKRPL